MAKSSFSNIACLLMELRQATFHAMAKWALIVIVYWAFTMIPDYPPRYGQGRRLPGNSRGRIRSPCRACGHSLAARIDPQGDIGYNTGAFALVAQWIEHLLAEQGAARSSRAEGAFVSGLIAKENQDMSVSGFHFCSRREKWGSIRPTFLSQILFILIIIISTNIS